MNDMIDEDRAFIEQCENEFVNRYTEKDYDYMLHIKIEMSRPPCVEPWYPKGENRDRNEQNRNDDRNDRRFENNGRHEYRRRRN